MIRRLLAWLDLRRRARANLKRRQEAIAKARALPHPERLLLSGAVSVMR